MAALSPYRIRPAELTLQQPKPMALGLILLSSLGPSVTRNPHPQLFHNYGGEKILQNI